MSDSSLVLEPARRPVPFRGGGFAPRRLPVVSTAGIALIVLAWQAASSLGWVDPVFLPSPWVILQILWKLLFAGVLWNHLIASLTRLGIGWSSGACAGILAGLALGLYSAARSVGVPLVSALITIPKVALLPLFIVWFGIGEWSKIMIIAFGVFFPTVISTYGAVDNVSKNLIRMAQSFEVDNASIVRKVVLPAALPGILSGCRLSVSIGIILLVTAEMIGSNEGIGAFILAAGNLYQVDRLLAGVALLSLIGLLLSAAITRAERRWLDWR
ncbi:ABC transporter permease [Variovorax paradoxus]|uniref:Aliphatic sulfonates transport permease protein SsuC n=1 Tax=Variovorax paradoxus TaxID=34073 RepID=A0A679JGU6_VARPD|nr:Putative aliphatic sulfonates transport permease protein SsuC [Variovorax paradoxus]